MVGGEGGLSHLSLSGLMSFRRLGSLLARAAPLKNGNEENHSVGEGMEVTRNLCSNRHGDLDPIASESL